MPPSVHCGPVTPPPIQRQNSAENEPGEARLTLKRSSKSLSQSVRDLLHGSCKEKEFQELQSIEKRRRTFLEKSYGPTSEVLFSYKGTFINVLMRDAFLWVTLAVYMLVRIFARLGLSYLVPYIDVALIGAIGALVSFFLVFFQVNQSNRYFKTYLASKILEGRIFDLALMVSSLLSTKEAHRFVRYMNAAHLLGYIGVSKTYTMSNFFHPLNREREFLTQSETKRIRQLSPESGGTAYRMLLSWCMNIIADNMRNKVLPPETVSLLQLKITEFRAAFADIYDLIDQPILFIFIHFVVFISAIYLPLFAISVAYQMGVEDFHWTSDLLGAVAIFLQCAFVKGIRIIAKRQMHPYEKDAEDFSVLTYVTSTFDESMKLVENSRIARDEDLEMGVCEKQNDHVEHLQEGPRPPGARKNQSAPM